MCIIIKSDYQRMEVREKVVPHDTPLEEEDDEVFTDGARNAPGFVYLLCERSSLEGESTGYYKIGVSCKPEKRLSDLQTGNPRPLHFQEKPTLVSKVISAEKSIHKAVSCYAASTGGGQEWFCVPQHNWKEFWNCYQKAIEPYLHTQKE